MLIETGLRSMRAIGTDLRNAVNCLVSLLIAALAALSAFPPEEHASRENVLRTMMQCVLAGAAFLVVVKVALPASISKDVLARFESRLRSRSHLDKLFAIAAFGFAFGERFGQVLPLGVFHPLSAILFVTALHPSLRFKIAGLLVFAALSTVWLMRSRKRIDHIAALWQHWWLLTRETIIWDELSHAYVETGEAEPEKGEEKGGS